MPDTDQSNPVVLEANVVSKKRSRFSFVWIVPIIAALAGAWITITTIRNQGPEITIVFKSAEGLEANKTQIKFNGVEVGEIKSIQLADDYKSVIATARMSPRTEEFLHKDTQFWVVRPQISGANISGLSTLISGAYIGMEAGHSKEGARKFTALDNPPLEVDGITGRYFTLKTPNLGSLGPGTPIYFRRVQAGQVASYQMDEDGKYVDVKIFVQSPYDQFVTTDTRFWNASGLNVSLSASGLQLQTESFLSILIGGVAFETPEKSLDLPAAPENTVFTLSQSREEAFRPPPVNPQEFVLVFKESVRGLSVGAPVELNGIPIGEVTDIRAQFDTEKAEFSAPVTIRVDMARYGVDVLDDGKSINVLSDADRHKAMDTLIARGLRAKLRTGSLITGARFVSMEFVPDAPPIALDWSQRPLHLPTLPGKLSSIESGVADVIAKLNQVPFKEIGDNLNKTIAGAQGTLTNANQLLDSAGQLVAPGSVLDAQLNNTLQQVGGAAQALRVLADYLERHPEAIIHGKPGDAK